ncbi:beta-galactosidase family protein [Paenibacillus sp. OV219]|uniref:glycoside hydrolase family 35 protein n=1 Tax=Paenibacillus sp. OV219 TaxID=1884377 RepID=UPI0008CBAC64|nr:beta-galactosidase family protein [Paenibacillus sp. OV219]SEO89768.1 beta-galactosidase [Paenibacillus sp. OV219]
MSEFMIEGNQFYYNGEPARILSGAMHYFRIVPEYWEDRLLKMKACGFNTVETYIAWNMHEPKEGQFCFEGIADIVRFISIAAKLDLFVIVRPSPYICAEWEFGGLPAWLLASPDMRLRCMDKHYLEKVDRYYDTLMPMLKPMLCTNGGPIIAMQIENEYGSYGNDHAYLEYLRQGMRDRGMDVLLFTSDGPEDHMLQGGSIPGVLSTVNFGSRPEEAFEKLQQYQPEQPLVCMEYWNGWFDHWGEEHHVRGFDDVADVLDRILKSGASVNFYMFHGGTNFGFYNGANDFGSYEPTVTSYDYNALLNESGDITDKYLAIRDVIARYVEIPKVELPELQPKRNYGRVQLTEHVPLFASLQQLSSPVQRTCPETMEKLGQNYGYILYTTRVTGPRAASKLALQNVRDRALVYLDGRYQGVIDRNTHDITLAIKENDILLEIPSEGATLSILVENMGRTNYGWMMKDSKGITEGVRLERQFQYDWTIHTLPLDQLTGLEFSSKQQISTTSTPTFYKGKFYVEEAGDTFLKLAGWTKGVAYLNGFNLGRYWNKGPQQTLYVPAPLLCKGENELIIFELHGTEEAVVTLQDYEELG